MDEKIGVTLGILVLVINLALPLGVSWDIPEYVQPIASEVRGWEIPEKDVDIKFNISQDVEKKVAEAVRSAVAGSLNNDNIHAGYSTPDTPRIHTSIQSSEGEGRYLVTVILHRTDGTELEREFIIRT